MSQQKDIFISENSIKQDHLSRFLSGFTFEPHDFGYQHDNPNAICENRISGDFELIFYTGGEGYITIGNKSYKCMKGDMLLIPPFLKHTILTPSDNPYANYYFHFDIQPFYKQKIFLDIFTASNTYVHHITDYSAFITLYEHAHYEYTTTSSGTYLYMTTLLSQLLVELYRSLPTMSLDPLLLPKPLSSSELIVEKAVSIMVSKIHASLQIGDICKDLSISEPYLYKVFSSVTGMSPGKYFSLQKIKYAEQLMKNTDMTLNEIAIHLNYSSPFYLSNVFKKYYKMSPRDYMTLFNRIY